jgi:L-lysine 2,3-aminomutase
MGVSEILASIDREIALLQQARSLLSGAAAPKKVGRPKKNASIVPVAGKEKKKAKKRNLTPEGRKRIAEAVKRRWEAQKKAASGK